MERDDGVWGVKLVAGDDGGFVRALFFYFVVCENNRCCLLAQGTDMMGTLTVVWEFAFERFITTDDSFLSRDNKNSVEHPHNSP